MIHVDGHKDGVELIVDDFCALVLDATPKVKVKIEPKKWCELRGFLVALVFIPNRDHT